MQNTFDIIKPNLYTIDDRIYFGIDPSDVVSAGRAVDEVVGKSIGELRVREHDLETIRVGRSKIDEEREVPLKQYLDELETRVKSNLLPCIVSASAGLFGLSYIVDAGTAKYFPDIRNWRKLQEDLADPNRAFDSWDAEDMVCRLDRQKTLEEMRKLQEKLSQIIPDNFAHLAITAGNMQVRGEQRDKCIGCIDLLKLRAKDRTAIEQTRAELVERLKYFEGPCLSLDAPQILAQTMRLYNNAEKLVQNYGDILLSPDWKTRMFRYDP